MSGILFFRREFLSDSIFLKVLNKSLYRNSCFVKRNYSFKSASELKTDYENYVAFKELRNNFREKVIYHSFYKYEDFLLQKKKEIGRSKSEEKNLSRISLAPASLKYILEDDNRSCLITNEQKDELTKSEETNSVVLPYNVSKVKVSGTDDVNFNNADECNFPENEKESVNCLYKESDVHNLIKDNTKHISNKKWMKDYDIFEEEQDSDEELLEFNKRSEYGTPDSTIPMSNVPCGGCGALLHCQDPGIPGYLPSKIFSSCTVQDLRSITCQRCHFMKNYNTALSVSVDPEYYPRLLSKIKNEEALVILMVDITDFPCSIWPGILNIIGRKRPLFLIGNKVDLLVGDRKGWIHRAKQSLQAAVPKNANVIYTSLISAKSGFGVEELINQLYNVWEYRGDVYLVGCTNVGKSTLFNALLQSDYCKVKAIDLLQRATTAPWPGTTLNLLKFPILRPSGVRLFLRTRRLQEEKSIKAAEKRLWKLQNAPKKQIEPVQLIGHIGHSFSKRLESDDTHDPFMYNKVRENELPESGLNPNDKDFKKSKWFYDTPGVVHSAQIIDLLTTDELMQTLPKTPIVHRVFIFRQNWTVFIAGLGRMDFIKLTDNGDGRDDFIKIVIFCPETLPVTICETEKADALYDEFVGTPIFVVPSSGKNRLKVWPPMKSSDDVILQGISFDESCADIVLSNAGWISITPNEEQLCKFRCWTPDGRGIYVRKVPLMKYAVTIHGQRIRKTPAYCRRYLKEAADDI